MKYDVLFITPPCKKEWQNLTPPMGIASLGAMLEEHKFSVKLVDGSAKTYKELWTFMKQNEFSIIGVSCTTTEQRIGVAKIARMAKKAHPKATIVIGGAHFTIFPHHAFKLAPTDIVVLGEGEMTMLDIAESIIRKGKTVDDFSDIQGIVYKKADQLITTDPRPLIQDMDSLPFPKYDDFDMDDYFKDVMFREAVPSTKKLRPGKIAIARGCPFSCKYCSNARLWGRKIRYKSTDRIMEEIKHLQNKYGVEWLLFQDDNLTFDNNRAIELSKRLIDEKIKITWLACSRVNGIKYETLKWMKKAGCYAVMYGVESGSAKILRNINKAQTPDQIAEAYAITRKAGLRPMGFLMVGNPGETWSTVYDTYKLWKRIQKPDEGIGAAVTWVFPDTGLYDDLKASGQIDDDYWLQDKPVPFYTVDHSETKLRMMRLYLYFLWFQHVLRKSPFKIKVQYVKQGFKWFWSSAKYLLTQKQLKTY